MINWIRAWIATIAIMCNPKLWKDIIEAEKEYERGESVLWTYDELPPNTGWVMNDNGQQVLVTTTTGNT